MKESLKNKKARALNIINALKEEYPESNCTLNYSDPLQLLIATQLAAQCTDARVNMVTPELFKKYPDVFSFAAADELELREYIHSTGFYKNKARNIISCCRKIISDYNGKVPKNMDELLTLPGVGRKTANLVLGDIFKIPGIVVDTHAGRISRRLGFTENTDPTKVEYDLLKIIPAEEQTDFCHRLVDHGRACCSSRTPKCEKCCLSLFCPKII